MQIGFKLLLAVRSPLKIASGSHVSSPSSPFPNVNYCPVRVESHGVGVNGQQRPRWMARACLKQLRPRTLERGEVHLENISLAFLAILKCKTLLPEVMKNVLNFTTSILSFQDAMKAKTTRKNVLI